MNTRARAVGLLVSMLAFPLHGSAQEMSDYCALPPFITQTVPPNIMILLDNSCDMLRPAYDHNPLHESSAKDYHAFVEILNDGEGNEDGLCETGEPCEEQVYQGYFDPRIYYLYSAHEFSRYSRASIGSPVFSSTGENPNELLLLGNFLNYISTSRYDLLQHVLIGGKSASRSSNGNVHALISVNGAECSDNEEEWEWEDREYESPTCGCEFEIEDNALTIENIGEEEDDLPPSCAHGITDPSTGRVTCPIFRLPNLANVSSPDEGPPAGQEWMAALKINVAAPYAESPLALAGHAIEQPRGIVDDFEDQARWGLTTFAQVGSTVRTTLNECIAAAPSSSFRTSIENLMPAKITSAPLAEAYYNIVQHFARGEQTPDWQGPNCDPFEGDTIRCRKNVVLTLSSAYDVSGTHFTGSDCDVANNTASLVRNSCYANRPDLRNDVDGDQIISHYAVYTFGFDNDPVSGHSGNGTTRQANRTILEDATRAGGGNKEGRDQFYDASVEGMTLQDALSSAISDILTRAASGTSVSVLSTSSRGIGSMVQAHFLAGRKEGTREVAWTGYLRNIWIDPQDNLRDDNGGTSPPDYKLILDSAGSIDGDAVMKLYFNPTTNQTEAGLFTTTADGSGGTLAACSDPPRKDFDRITTLWEAGRKLAATDPDSRTIYTSTKVLRETARGTVDLFDGLAPGDLFTMSSLIEEQEGALNIPASGPASGDPAAFDRTNIVDYVRGKDLEATHPGDFRDRRITLDDSSKPDKQEIWKLGDIMGSTPKVVSNMPLNSYQVIYNDVTYHRYTSSSAYRERSSLALVGANDGMLHAFRVGYLKDDNLQGGVKAVFHDRFSDGRDPSGTSRLGKEVWAYVPLNAFPYLKYLAHKNYGSCHLYYNDLSVKVVDVSTGGHADEPKATDGSSWETILIGGMRFGGACAGPGAEPPGPPTGTPADIGYSAYFAVNISDLEHPVPLWEFSDVDMGYSTSLPAVVRTGERDTNGYWYVVFGSGSTVLAKRKTDAGRTTTGHVYILDLRTGALEQKIPLGHNAIVGDVLAVDNDFDYHSEKIYFGTSYRDADAGSWKGKLMSVAIPDHDLNPGSWTPPSPGYTVLFEGNYPFTASPDATKDEAGSVWVYAGSGKYYSDLDEEDTSQQIFIGLKDDAVSVSYPVGEGDTAPAACDDPPSCPSGSLCDTTNCTTTGTITATVDVCDYDKRDNTFKKKTIVTAVNSTSIPPAPETGWKIYLAKGERVISRPLAVGGLIDFLTYAPSADDCAFGGDAYLYSLGYVSGVAPDSVAIRAPGATSGTSGTVTVKKAVPLGPGAPPTGDAIIIPPQKEGREQLKKKIQVATGVIVETENKPVISTTSKIIHWLKK